MRTFWCQIGSGFCLLITGGGIGWLMGLSVSPIASIVVTSVIGIAVALVTAMSGLNDPAQTDQADVRQRFAIKGKYSTLPIAVLVAGIALGGSCGIWTRTHDILGQDLNAEIEKWRNITGLNKNEIGLKLFETSLGAGTGGALPIMSTSASGILFSVSTDDCTNLQFKKGEDLRNEMLASTETQLNKIAMIISDTQILEKLVTEVLCVAGS